MGIPGSPYSRDFGDPVVIIGTPFCRDWRYGSTLTVATGSVLKTCQVQDECKVAKSGGKSIMGDRERSQEPQPEEKGTDGRFSFNAV